MTLHVYEPAGFRQPVIRAGWDRPLNGFFLTILDTNGAPVYSSNCDPTAIVNGGFLPSVDDVQRIAEAQGIKLPPAMLQQLELDAALRRGNLIHHYDDRGTYIATEQVVPTGLT